MKNSAIALVAVAAIGRWIYRAWDPNRLERGTTLPGDELIPDPAIVDTQAVWVDAPPEVIWPWLVQIGQDRGGLYSYERLENLLGLEIHNADRIHPEWQHLEPGDLVRLVPEGWAGLRKGLALPVARVVPNECLVLLERRPELPWDAVWSFHIIPQWDDRCRLVSRSRQHRRNRVDSVAAAFGNPVTAFMTRGMLNGIKRRAEAEYAAMVSDGRTSPSGVTADPAPRAAADV